MYRFIGESGSYGFFNSIAVFAYILSLFLFIKEKRNALGLYSRYAVFYTSKTVPLVGKILKQILTVVELLIMAFATILATACTVPMGELVGTGYNYFGALFAFPVVWFIASIILRASPLKNIDITTMMLPVHLFFIKIACFCNGCCWGIPWEYGPYNHHYDHPGNQVPVQAIEAFWAIPILIFLLIYRKKAKPGTLFPMYMILYSATRFCSEFFRREENVLWILKTYHLLCIAGVVIGLVLLLVVKFFGDKIQNLFEKPHRKLDLKIAQYEEQKTLKLAEEKAHAEIERLERLEKAKLARQKAKARKK